MAKKKKNNFVLDSLVEVEWHDACGKSNWCDISEYEDHAPILCKTAGYLVSKTTDKITIALTQAENQDVNQAISIPAGWIRKIRTLK